MESGERDARERALRPEQGPHRVADRRHRHPAQHRGRGNGRHRHDEQRRHGAADDRRHVGDRSGGRSRRDRHPDGEDRTAGQGDRSTRCRARRSPARSPRSATARSRPTGAVVVDAGDQLQGDRARSTRRSPTSGPGFTCTAEITTAVRDGRRRGADPGDDRSRNGGRRQGQHRARADDTGKRAAVRAPAASQAAELKPGQTRKELEGVFVVQRQQGRCSMPVKTGIAGEKYFEVLSGLKDGDAVIIGPFSSVRELARRRGGESRARRRRQRHGSRTPATHEPVLRSGGIALERDLGEQAAIVSDRARKHRRGDVDHRRRVADPGDERLRDQRHPLRRRRRQLHDSAHAGRPHARPTRSGSATTRAITLDDAAAVRKYSDNVGAVAAQAQSRGDGHVSERDGRRRAGAGRLARLRLLRARSTPSAAV